MRFLGGRRREGSDAAAKTDADAAARAEGYQSAEHRRRSDAAKRARRLRTPGDRIAREQSGGMVARAEYLTPEQEQIALQPGPDGLIEARLERVRDRVLVVTPSGLVNPNSRTAHSAGLHSFKIAGTAHYEAAVNAGNFTPGAPVRLVRESKNPHDAAAIAIYAENGRSKAGYVPSTVAKRLSRLMDDVVELVAVSVRGPGPGSDGADPRMLVCARSLFEHLTRP